MKNKKAPAKRVLSKPAAHSKSTATHNPIIEAAIEVGHAAESLQDSLDHIKKARTKGARAIAPMKRAGKKAMQAVKKSVGIGRKKKTPTKKPSKRKA